MIATKLEDLERREFGRLADAAIDLQILCAILKPGLRFIPLPCTCHGGNLRDCCYRCELERIVAQYATK